MLPYVLTQFACLEVNCLRRLSSLADPDIRLALALFAEVTEQRDMAVAERRETMDAAEQIREERDELTAEVERLRSALAQSVGERDRAVTELKESLDAGEELLALWNSAQDQLVWMKFGRTRGGRKPFGVRDGEREKVRKILRLHGDGLSFGEIAEKLNQLGWGTQTGKKWRAQQVSDVVKRWGKTSAPSASQGQVEEARPATLVPAPAPDFSTAPPDNSIGTQPRTERE